MPASDKFAAMDKIEARTDAPAPDAQQPAAPAQTTQEAAHVPAAAPNPQQTEGAQEPTEASRDSLATRSADAPVENHFEPPPQADTGANTGPLNATPGQDPTKPATAETQKTGPSDTAFRAPTMTPGSAINNIEVMWGELKMKLHDFDHEVTGELAELVQFVKSRTPPPPSMS